MRSNHALRWGAVILGVAACGVARGQPFGGGSTSRSYCLGTLWYLQGMALHDQVSIIDGGAEGSSFLAYPVTSNGLKTEWTLLSGYNMWVAPVNETHANYAIAPGRCLRTAERQPNQAFTGATVGQADLRDVNDALLNIYNATKEDHDNEAIRTIPFLTGPGFTDNGNSVPGMKYSDAAAMLEAIHLEIHLSSGSTNGFVTSQDPAGGANWPENSYDTVNVTTTTSGFARAAAPAPPTNGDTPETAIAIDPAATTPYPVNISASTTDQRWGPPTCQQVLQTRDVFYKWHHDRAGTVTVEKVSSRPDGLILSAWTAGREELACNQPYGGTISFKVEPGKDYFVIAEFPNNMVGRGSLKITFKP